MWAARVSLAAVVLSVGCAPATPLAEAALHHQGHHGAAAPSQFHVISVGTTDDPLAESRFALIATSGEPGFVQFHWRKGDSTWRPATAPHPVTPGTWVRFPDGSRAESPAKLPRGPSLGWSTKDHGGVEFAAVFTRTSPSASLTAPLLAGLAADSPETLLSRALARHLHAYVALLQQRGLTLDWLERAKLGEQSATIDPAGRGALRVQFAHGSRSVGEVPTFRRSEGLRLDGMLLRDGQGRHDHSLAKVPDGASVSVARLVDLVARTFPKGTAILLYDHHLDTLSSFVIDASGVRAANRRTITQGDLMRTVLEWRAAVVSGALGRDRALTLAESLALDAVPDASASERRALEVLMPEPIRRALSDTRHLVVVPVHGIGAVPFAALRPFGQEWLVDRMSVTFAPSVRDLWLDPPSWRWPPRNPVVIGNPAYTGDDGAIPPLPGAEREAEFVAHRLGRDAWLGSAATREAFLGALSDSDFVFVATHAVADEEDPLRRSALMLAGPRSAWLNPYDVMKHFEQQRLGAQLVVLSACQTALGGFHAGGVIGMARAFQLAGAPRVVMSQWRVADEPTEQLMRRFVDELPRHVPSEALRRAMVALRKDYPHPAAWAPFTLFGLPR